MENNITRETLQHITKRIIANADELLKVEKEKRTDFDDGLSCAYYEVLDILKSEIGSRDDNLEDYGLDVDLESKYA